MTLDHAVQILNFERHLGDYLWCVARDGSGEHALGLPRARVHRPNAILPRSEAIRLAMQYDREYRQSIS